jgi:hypothetical protein
LHTPPFGSLCKKEVQGAAPLNDSLLKLSCSDIITTWQILEDQDATIERPVRCLMQNAPTVAMTVKYRFTREWINQFTAPIVTKNLARKMRLNPIEVTVEDLEAEEALEIGEDSAEEGVLVTGVVLVVVAATTWLK